MTEPAKDLLAQVFEVNLGRRHEQLWRRVIKVQEECGELAEAFLGVSSSHNYKNKSWEDVREEAIDVLIVAADIALTPHPDENFASSADILKEVNKVASLKLAKWIKNQKTRQEAIS